MKQEVNTNQPQLGSYEVKEALKLLKEHAAELSDLSLQFSIPHGYKKDQVKEFIASEIMKRSKYLREKYPREKPTQD